MGRFVDIHRSELSRTVLSFFILMLLIASYTVVKSVRDAVFLSKFGITQLSFIAIALAFLTSFVVSLYLRLTGGVPRNVLIGATDVLVAASLCGIWMLLGVDPPAAWVPWALYIWSSIFGVFTVMQFWLLANDLFDPREAKRLFGIVGAGAILGGIVGGFVSRSLATSIGIRGLLLLAAGMYIGAGVLANIVWPLRRQESLKKRRARKEKPTGRGFAVVRDHPYVRQIALALLLSVLATTLLDWQFKSITKAHFAGRANEMAGFFGALYGYLSIASFVLQTFVTGWLLRRFGIGVGLLLLPISVLGGSAGILFSPLLPISGLTAASGAKVAEGGLRFAIDKASMELMWLPVPPKIKEQGKAFVDTVVDRLATGLTGLLWLALAGAGVATAGRVHFISILVIITVVVWLMVLLQARRAYVDVFRETLATRSLDPEQMTTALMDASAQQSIRSALDSDDPREVGFALYLLRDVRPLPDLHGPLDHDDPTVRREALELLANRQDRDHRRAAAGCLVHPAAEVREAAVKYLCRTAPLGEDPLIAQIPGDDPATLFAASVIRLGSPTQAMTAAEQIRKLLQNVESEQRPLLVRMLGSAPPELAAALLAPLLGDDDNATADAALRASGQSQASGLVPTLVQMLHDRRFRPRAAAALREISSAALPQLRTELAAQNPLEVRVAVVRLLGASGEPSAAADLLPLLRAGEPRLSLSALRALIRLGNSVQLKVAASDVRTLIDETIAGAYRQLLLLGLGSWATARAADEPDQLFERALRERTDIAVSRLFSLLALLHDPDDIRAAHDGVRSPLKSIRSSSVEFLDNLLHRDMSGKLLPLLEDSDPQQFASTAKRFANAAPGRADALSELLSGSDTWMRAVACWTVGNEGLANLRGQLEAVATEENEVAPVARRALERLDHHETKEPTMALTIVEKALKLKTVDVLQRASSEDLAQVAQIAEEVDLSADTPVYGEGDAPDALFVVISGAIKLSRGEEEIGTVGPGEAFGTWALFDEAPRVASATTTEPTVMLKVDREEFLELLADRVDIVQAVFKAMVARLRQLADVVKGGP